MRDYMSVDRTAYDVQSPARLDSFWGHVPNVVSHKKHEASLRATLGRCRTAQRRADQGWRCLRRSRV